MKDLDLTKRDHKRFLTYYLIWEEVLGETYDPIDVWEDAIGDSSYWDYKLKPLIDCGLRKGNITLTEFITWWDKQFKSFYLKSTNTVCYLDNIQITKNLVTRRK